MNYPLKLMQMQEWAEWGLPAQGHYSPDLLYHVWPEHPEEVALASIALAERCKPRGIELKVGEMVTASPWHDAGMADDYEAKGFAMEEQYAKHLANEFLSSRGVEQTFIEGVGGIIISSVHGAVRTDPTEVAFHRADIDNIGSDYLRFAYKSWLLYRELKMQYPDMDFNDWQAKQLTLIEGFFIPEALRELPILGEPVGTQDSFDTVAARNTAWMAAEKSEADLMSKLDMAA